MRIEERGAVRKRAYRRSGSRQRKRETYLFGWVLGASFLMILNLLLIIKMQVDVAGMKEQVNTIKSCIAVIQEKLGMTDEDFDISSEKSGLGTGTYGSWGQSDSLQIPDAFRGVIRCGQLRCPMGA